MPLDKLRDLAVQLPTGSDREAWWTYTAFLDCYALVAPAEAEPLVLKALKSHPFRGSDDLVDSDLAKALCTARGVVDPYEKIVDRYQKLGFHRLAKAERTYLAVMFLYVAGEGPGYTSFFENYSAEAWNDLQAAFVELKEPKFIKLMSAWATLFHGQKPGEKGFDYEAVEEAFYERTGKELHEEIDRISQAHRSETDLDLKIHLWAAEHAEELKTAWRDGR